MVDIVRHVADVLAAFGERLRAGEFIITGSVVPPISSSRTRTASHYALDPVASVSVRFER